MTTTNGAIRVELDDDNRVVLTLIGFPAGHTKVSISPDEWSALVTEVIHLRSTLRIKARTKVYTAADAARAVES